MIQDTSFIIDLLNGDEGARLRLELLDRERVPQRVSSVTVLELHEGVVRSSKPESERQQVLSVLESKDIVPADRAVMKKAGRLSGMLVNDGQRIDREDCIIAATAMTMEEPVVTRNGSHFERIDGIEVEDY